MQVSNFLTIERFRVTLTGNGKREIQVDSISNKKIAGKNSSKQFLWIKLAWNNLFNFFVEVMNSKRQEKGKLGHVVQIHFCHLKLAWQMTNNWKPLNSLGFGKSRLGTWVKVILITLKLNIFAGKNIPTNSEVRLLRCKFADLWY